MKPLDEILIASSNAGKVREFEVMLSDLFGEVRVLTLRDVADIAPPDETAPTFAGNAKDKALYYAKCSGKAALADDSGLAVDALNGAPGVFSARYAGAAFDRGLPPTPSLREQALSVSPQGAQDVMNMKEPCLPVSPRDVNGHQSPGAEANDEANIRKLLLAMEGQLERSARFHCALCLVSAAGEVIGESEGLCEGSIGFEARGDHGFGYDPVFLPTARPGLTMAELPPAEKSAISHRGDAIHRLRANVLRQS